VAETEHRINERMMARWTRLVGIFTIVLALIAAITAYILYETDQTNRASQRASVTSNELNIETIHAKDGSVITWLVAPVVVNGGSTRTENARMGTGLNFWFAKDFPGTQPPMEPIGGIKLDQKEFRNIVLGPKASVSKNIIPFHISASSLPTIRSGEIRMFVVGEVLYNDVFTHSHITRFCYLIWAYPENQGIEGITYSLCGGVANCTDKECKTQ
jgi:hypothetical protein